MQLRHFRLDVKYDGNFSKLNSIKYRPEIDGLRAVAILPVIGFHMGVDWLPGGFIGVYVFFVISGYLITSIILREHFDNFSDTGLGAFMAKNADLITTGDSLGLKADLALAPFDLGVTQQFELKSAPSEIKGIDEVNIRLIRKSGQPDDWVRLNKNLFDDLRTQFLLWRSLPKETMEHYRQETLVRIRQDAVAET